MNPIWNYNSATGKETLTNPHVYFMEYTAQCNLRTVNHYSNNSIMSAKGSQITGDSIVYSTVCSGADQINIKAPRHWPLWGESPNKAPVTRKMFPFDDVIIHIGGGLNGLLFNTPHFNKVNWLARRDMAVNLQAYFPNTFYELISWALLVKMILCESHRTPLMISHHPYK